MPTVFLDLDDQTSASDEKISSGFTARAKSKSELSLSQFRAPRPRGSWVSYLSTVTVHYPQRNKLTTNRLPVCILVY